MLTRDEQDEILSRAFAPDGELGFSMGRISMNANDYALDWYSCSDIQGDFDLKHFNIERDKMTIIPYIRAAQKYNPDMTFWMSPWSPPAWMKANNHYAVQSSKHSDMDPRLDCLLYGDGDRSDNEQVNPDKRRFPGAWLCKAISYRIHGICNAMPICFASSSTSMANRECQSTW